jgi:putative serine protease PepD
MTHAYNVPMSYFDDEPPSSRPVFPPPPDRQPPVTTPPQERRAARDRGRVGHGVLPLLLAAVLGGGVSAVAVELLDEDAPVQTVTTENTTGFAQAAPVEPSSAPAPQANPASAGAKSIQQIYRETRDGVVRVENGQGQGSGFVVSADGFILTNAHVVGSAKTVTVSFSDDDEVRAKVVGTDNGTDVAVLKVDGKKALKPIPLGSSERLQVGDAVVAIGNPFGLDRTVTAGIVSALDRSITSPNNFQLRGAIQTDAAINHGNSGGPLLDNRGRVIGINAQIAASGVDANVGVGFAIPIDTAKRVADEIRATGKAQHAWMGVRLAPVDATLAERENLAVRSGAMVHEVTAGGPAAKAGLRGANRTTIVDGTQYAIGGDIIVAIDGQPIEEFEDLQAIVAAKKPATCSDWTSVATAVARRSRFG